MSIFNGIKSLCPLHRHILNRQMIPWLVFILVNFLLLHSLCRVTPTYFTSLIGGLPMLQMIAQAFCQKKHNLTAFVYGGVGELLYHLWIISMFYTNLCHILYEKSTSCSFSGHVYYSVIVQERMKITLVPKISPGGTVSVGNSFVRPKLGLHALLEKTHF